jgi:hypothetical protein
VTGLTGNLASPTLKAAVADVWRKLPQEDRAILKALRTMVFEGRLTDHLGLTTIRKVQGEDRRVVILDSSLKPVELARQVVAHEFAHVVLRHVESGVGLADSCATAAHFSEVEYFTEWAERQADWLATRWGFPPPGRERPGR